MPALAAGMPIVAMFGEGDVPPSQQGQVDPSQQGQVDPSQQGQVDPSQQGQVDPSQQGQVDPSQQGQVPAAESLSGVSCEVARQLAPDCSAQWDGSYATGFWIDGYYYSCQQMTALDYQCLGIVGQPQVPQVPAQPTAPASVDAAPVSCEVAYQLAPDCSARWDGSYATGFYMDGTYYSCAQMVARQSLCLGVSPVTPSEPEIPVAPSVPEIPVAPSEPTDPSIPALPEPVEPQPSVPQPDISQPGDPQPGISQPGVPQPSIPQPGEQPEPING
jgi:hypothetical protein